MTKAYYNEIDPKAAAWLRELIAQGLIPMGDVDTRSITEATPHDIAGYTQHHFFAGIGGWPYALRLAGWPDDRPVRTGSCPCQPFSTAGDGLEEKDPRHLWPWFRDLIAFGEPTVAFGEQVASAAGRRWLARVRTDLEGLGYAVGAADLCAAGVGAPHLRQRLFWVADPSGIRCKGRTKRQVGHSHRWTVPGGRGEPGGLGNSNSEHPRRHTGAGIGEEEGCVVRSIGDLPSASSATRAVGDATRDGLRGRRRTEQPKSHQSGYWSVYDTISCADGKTRRIEPGTFPLAHGIPGRVAQLRGLGNAIVPQVAATFVRAFLDCA